MPGRPVVELGCQVRFGGRTWTVAALADGQVRLVAEDGAVAAVLLSLLFADAGFEVLDAPGVSRVPPLGLLQSLPEAVRERALAWERHVREVETGQPGGPGAAGLRRAEYDPQTRTMTQREEAKAAELSAAGMPTSAVTVRRMRARYRQDGVWGLVDHRATRPRTALGRADERVVAAVREVLEAGRERSSGTLGRLRVYTERLLAEQYGEGVVRLPSGATFNRLVHALADGRGLLGSARQRRWRSARPAPPFVPTTVMAPGELVMMDSTVLDAFVVLDDGVVERPELTIALDVATRTICAAVLRAKGTRSVDAAQLLAQMMVPAPMRPGWAEALAMEHSVVPYERLLSVDARLEGAAARPVITPQTIVVDQGNVFISSSFIATCESLGISVQPAPPGNGPAKGHVERTYSSINTLFVQHVAGYTASHTGERGKDPAGEAVWTLTQLAEMFQEWIICAWQEREHDGLRHPMMPRCALSPNEMWAALVAVCGYVPVPLGREDYIELMPVKRQKINDYGIRIDYRTYDHQGLNPHRGERSPAGDGLWEIHYDPHAPGQIWVRLPKPDQPRGYGWEAVPWIHHTLVTAPFTDFTWQHIKRTVARRGSRVQHEHDLAVALRELLERAAAGHGTRREKVVAARARTAATDGAVWGVLYGRQPEAEVDEPGEDVFDDSEDDEEPLTDDGALSIWPTKHTPQSDSPGGAVQKAALPASRRPQVTVYDPFEESSPVSTGAVGFAPLAPPTVWQGWDAFVHRAPASARDVTDGAWSQTEREDYHSELAVMRTPAMDSVFTAVRRLLLVNRRQQSGARRGLIISGPATTGKTTTMMALGRSFQLADARQHPGQDDRRPVLFISVPPAATPKMLVSEFARFLGMPITDRLNQTQITGAVCDLLCELGTQLVLIDDVHLLDTQRRAGAETSDQLKHLGERIPATFVYSAIDVETSSLLSGVRGAQIAGRFKIFRHRPLAYATEQDKAVWDDLVRAMETLLRLGAHRPGTLVKHAAYLHARTAGRIGSLSHLIREAALVAITEGTERITKQLLSEVELDAAAETQARPARPARRK